MTCGGTVIDRIRSIDERTVRRNMRPLGYSSATESTDRLGAVHGGGQSGGQSATGLEWNDSRQADWQSYFLNTIAQP